MEMDICKIRDAKSSIDSVKEVMRRVNEALSPFLTDINLMECVYQHFEVFITSAGQRMDANNRKKFLFIVVYLFCPAVLIGDAMPRGFRDRLKDIVHAKSATTVSNDVVNLLFLYNHYRDFRDDVNNAYAYIVEAMQIKPR